MPGQEQVIRDLEWAVGKECVSGNIYERVCYGQDAAQPDLDPEKIPIAVVKPTTTEGVAKTLRYANERKIPVYIHGAGTAFKGSPKPKRPGSILLSTQGLTTIEPHEEDMYYELGAGVNLYELEKLFESRGYMLPMTIGSKFASTIGGALSINTIGHMVDICVGKIIDYVMGVELMDLDPEQCGKWSTCCGGGGLEATHPGLSERIGMRRAEELVKTGAALILSNCPACDLQLTRMIKKLDPNIKVVDLIRFFDDALS